PIDENVTRFLPQSRSCAFWTRRIAAISAEEHAHVQLVFFCFQVVEEVAHAIEDEGAFVLRELPVGHIQSHVFATSGFLEVRKVRAIARLGPRFYRSLVYAFGFVRDNKVKVEIDRITEPLAARTSPK